MSRDPQVNQRWSDIIRKHIIKSWSATQKVIALSSGEAEYYGLVKGASVGIGMRGMLEDLGVKCRVRVSTDASAAKGIASRRGLGKVRHIEVCQLWLQQKVQEGKIRVWKVKGTNNPAGLRTKHVNNETLTRHLDGLRLDRRQKRHHLHPSVARDAQAS